MPETKPKSPQDLAAEGADAIIQNLTLGVLDNQSVGAAIDTVCLALEEQEGMADDDLTRGEAGYLVGVQVGMRLRAAGGVR